ncbi:MAG: guanylate kinase [Oscillospiraceae bacterium]|nr:guanylate kinase [Oscillospiraceae bacterium]MBR5071205.1 guanylate kinase [Oscillospiraceae bacterium]
MDDRKLIVISGPSGCGKDTVLRKIRELDDSIAANISYTTRSPRPGETDGVNYHFVSKEQFLENIENGMMLEYNQYAGNYYGTSRESINRFLEDGTTVVLVIDVNGGRNVKKYYPNALLLFLMPPSIGELRRRLIGRGGVDEESIKARLRIAEEEILYAQNYDLVIVNRDVEECARECLEAISAWEKAEPDNK